MITVTPKEFRANQGKFLCAAIEGETVVLTSKYGNFRISPVSDEEFLAAKIHAGMEEFRLIQDGKLQGRPARDMLREI